MLGLCTKGCRLLVSVLDTCYKIVLLIVQQKEDRQLADRAFPFHNMYMYMFLYCFYCHIAVYKGVVSLITRMGLNKKSINQLGIREEAKVCQNHLK